MGHVQEFPGVGSEGLRLRVDLEHQTEPWGRLAVGCPPAEILIPVLELLPDPPAEEEVEQEQANQLKVLPHKAAMSDPVAQPFERQLREWVNHHGLLKPPAADLREDQVAP
jgi:hypothetical protein